MNNMCNRVDISNGIWFFENFSGSMMNQGRKFDPIAILNLLKRMNCTDHENGPIKVQNSRF